jgi:hypothetical protein
MRVVRCTALGFLLLVVTGPVWADIVPLRDLNSTATFDTTSGQVSWTVDGVGQLYAQQFYYNSGAGVHNITTLGDTDYLVSNTNRHQGNDVMDVTFTNGTILRDAFGDPVLNALGDLTITGATLTVEVKYSLGGSALGSGDSDLGEQILINNTGGAIKFFQYVDLNLNGTAGNDTVRIENGRVAVQTDPSGVLAESVRVFAPDRYDCGTGGPIPPGGSVYADVTSGADLPDNVGPYGPGDVAWAFQWNLGTGSYSISKDKSIDPVPEPLTMLGVLASVGCVGTYLRRKRKQAFEG